MFYSGFPFFLFLKIFLPTKVKQNNHNPKDVRKAYVV